MNPIRLVFADDQRMVRETISALLLTDQRLLLTGLASCGEAAILDCIQTDPSVAIIDLDLKDCSGRDTILHIRNECPSISLIAIGNCDRSIDRKYLISIGVLGLISKNSSFEVLVSGIIAVNKQQKYICPDIKNIIAGQAVEVPQKEFLQALTKKQQAIADLLCRGFTSEEIASCKGLSIKTVETHRYHILQQLGLPDNASLRNFCN